MNVTVGEPARRTHIFSDPSGHSNINCISCFITGGFEVTGCLSSQNLGLQSLSIDAAPLDFVAELELEATIRSKTGEIPISLQYIHELYAFGIPNAGFAIKGNFKVGATFSYRVGVNTSFTGAAIVDTGLRAAVPNHAGLTAEVHNPVSSVSQGLDMTPVFGIRNISASVSIAAFSQPKFALEFELIAVVNVNIAPTMEFPQISATLSARYDEIGYCEQPNKFSKTGIELHSDVDVELDLQVDAGFGLFCTLRESLLVEEACGILSTSLFDLLPYWHTGARSPGDPVAYP